MRPVIEVENLSKKYRISHESKAQYLTLRDEIAGSLLRPFRFLTGNRRTTEEFWALKDVSFDVKQGEVLGIIGRNGAGKSTLLKILSRVTEPTAGRAILRGRAASLLEVGTGFHPELTGRENIFLNGVLLGMGQREIRRKFDEIVAFSEIEKFLDTPVKFYSSGMYVRLAFAVAAHLEPEILIVDEVLAVGDAAFQKKSLGKMSAVAKEGRTILFVSHNMGAIGALCTRGVLLEGGRVAREGGIREVIQRYLGRGGSQFHYVAPAEKAEDKNAFIKSLTIKMDRSEGAVHHIPFQVPFMVEAEVWAKRDLEAVLGVVLTDGVGQVLTTVHTQEIGEEETTKTKNLCQIKKGLNKFTLYFSNNYLRPGTYYLGGSLFSRRLIKNYDSVEQALSFEVGESNEKVYFDERQMGIFFPKGLLWERS